MYFELIVSSNKTIVEEIENCQHILNLLYLPLLFSVNIVYAYRYLQKKQHEWIVMIYSVYGYKIELLFNKDTTSWLIW